MKEANLSQISNFQDSGSEKNFYGKQGLPLRENRLGGAFLFRETAFFCLESQQHLDHLGPVSAFSF
jgi:hypothetical protein